MITQKQLDLNQSGRALEVCQRLVVEQGERQLKPRRDSMRELISTMLSHRTTHANEEAAYERMWQRFGSWEAIRDAPVDELIEMLRPATFPEPKAANIKATLEQIIAERGMASIDFLADLPTQVGLEWLMRMPGVGLKTASLVLLFCFAKPILPVDTHVHRVSQRVGLIGPKVNPTAAHALLQAQLPQEALLLYNFHVAVLRHGQRVCVWRAPHCEHCVLTDLCDWYQHRRSQP